MFVLYGLFSIIHKLLSLFFSSLEASKQCILIRFVEACPAPSCAKLLNELQKA